MLYAQFYILMKVSGLSALYKVPIDQRERSRRRLFLCIYVLTREALARVTERCNLSHPYIVLINMSIGVVFDWRAYTCILK